MVTKSRVSIFSIFLVFFVFSAISLVRAEDESESKEETSSVLTLDSSNFHEAIAKHPFIVVEFYAPWCGHCKKLAPEYEKAASLLSKHEPPVVLAKVDASEEVNRELASKYEVKGFPTIIIFRNEGKNTQEYKGPREADGIVEYLKKQVGPASAEIKSSEDTDNIISGKKIIIVGVFTKFSGEEFENFTAVADKLRSDYDFRHVSDAKLLPRGDSTVKGPIVRLFKPYDEQNVDFEDFHVEALENFIEVASIPIVTTFNKDPDNHPLISKFFNSDNAKAMLFLNFSSEQFDAFKSNYHEVASNYKGKGFSFLIGDLDDSQNALRFFGAKEDQAPLIVLQENDGKKYLKLNVEPDQIATWLKEYKEGSLKPFIKSEPIPEVNNEPVKVVVADNLHDVVNSGKNGWSKSEPIPEVNNEPVKVVVADNLHDVVNSGKNVLLEFYAPWCGHCKKLAPILDEVAVSFEKDADVIIAKMDATANDVPNEYNVRGYPTLFFFSASGKLTQYDGDRAKEDIINFINTNRDTTTAQSDTPVQSSEPEPVKDEL